MTNGNQSQPGVSSAGAQLDGGVWELVLNTGVVFYVWIDATGGSNYAEDYRSKPTDNLSFPLSHTTYTSLTYTRKSTSVSTTAQYNSWMNQYAPNHTKQHLVTLKY